MEKATEISMNLGLNGRDLREVFATDEYQVRLVANTFQTGLDQPLLMAMYVDKRLSGVGAVQTLPLRNHPGPAQPPREVRRPIRFSPSRNHGIGKTQSFRRNARSTYTNSTGRNRVMF